MLVFATTDDYARIIGAPAPAEFAARAATASRWVRTACAADVFATAPGGLPADPDLTEALAEAVCLQVQLWDALGVDPVAGVAALPPSIASTGLDGASVSYQVAAQDQARTAAVSGLCDAALSSLRAVGLASAAVAS